jgi:hypothetical protein
LNSDDYLVEVFVSNETEAQIIKDLLGRNDIPCLLKAQSLRLIDTGTFLDTGATKVLVWNSMADKARELIQGEEDA